MFQPGLLGCALLVVTLLVACQPTDTREMPQESLPASIWFPIGLGDTTIRVQLALTEAERQKGLMHRESLGTDEGMLFLFETPSRQSFWMFNTPLPLSIGYFSPDGELQEIYWMYPHDRNPVRSNSHKLQYALEMNQGWFRQNNITPGAQLNLKDLARAIRGRGMDPQKFGLE